ncbi:hypothetical protein BAJUN_00510 [Bajunvirus bajun]|uniref:Uncharacterized protein n=1 Tax=Brevundimonas phage vB_BgoS-Bajun TaxID=2948594 RepID=A0A9E7N4D6_9CAUD|nr:hypothetical protein BAJUN_00510 [Brevundimonas phage vB_BgoS-Bajun]
MPLYRTSYKIPNGETLATQCYACDDDHLIEVLTLRGMGETRDDPHPYGYSAFFKAPVLASTLLAKNQLAAANHALIWAAMIASKAGIIDPWDLLNDRGMIHEMAHAMHSKEINGQPFGIFDNGKIALMERLEAFEMLVPGLHKCWAGEDTSVRYAPGFRGYDLPSFFDITSKGFSKTLEELVKKRRPKSAPNTLQGMLYGYQRDAMDHFMSGFTPRDKDAPRAKIGSKDFDQQRLKQMNAVKQDKSELVAKLRAQHKAKTTGVKVTAHKSQLVVRGVTGETTVTYSAGLTGNHDESAKAKKVNALRYPRAIMSEVKANEVVIKDLKLSVQNSLDDFKTSLDKMQAVSRLNRPKGRRAEVVILDDIAAMAKLHDENEDAPYRLEKVEAKEDDKYVHFKGVTVPAYDPADSYVTPVEAGNFIRQMVASEEMMAAYDATEAMHRRVHLAATTDAVGAFMTEMLRGVVTGVVHDEIQVTV